MTSDRYYPFPDYDATVASILGPRIAGRRTEVEDGLLAYRLPVAFEYRHHLLLRGFEGTLARFRPDIVHVYQAFTLPTLQAALAKKRLGFGLVVSSSMEREVFYPQSAGRRGYYWIYGALGGLLLRRRVDAFTAVGVGARDIVTRVLGLTAEQVAVFPLGADSERFQFDAVARARVRSELGVGDDLVLAIYAGKLIPRKDVHVLLEALHQLNSHARVGVLLVGNGTPAYGAHLREIAQTAPAPVFFRPAVPNSELPRYFSASDIGVWPSESSNAAIEAVLVGLPLVVSASDATEHYMAHNSGLSFARGNRKALARCLEQLARTPESRRGMGARGREYARAHLTWEVAALRTLRLYETIIASHNRARVRYSSGAGLPT